MTALLAAAALVAVGWWAWFNPAGPPPPVDSLRAPPGRQPVGEERPAASPPSPPQGAIAALLQEVLDQARQLAARFPRRVEACHAAAVAHYELGRAREAERYWEQVLELDPTAYDTYRWLAYVAMDRGQYGRAAELYQQLLAREPASSDARLGLAEAHIGLGDMSAARRLLEPLAVAGQPDAAPALLLLGQVCLELQDYRGAKEHYLQAAHLMPRAPEPQYGLAQACARLGEADQSAEYQRRFRNLTAQGKRTRRDTTAVQADLAEARAKAAGILRALGETYAACGAFPEAERLRRRAAELQPADPAEEQRHANP